MIQPEIVQQADYEVLDKAQSSVLRTLIYFDCFNYPLTLEEIFRYSTLSSLNETKSVVECLIEQKKIGMLNSQYFLSARERIVEIREALNKDAEQYYEVANRYTRLISRFPFVRGVLITGSLSKGCMEKNGDIDYLIITEPNRLWLCRTLLTIYKKTVLFNSRKYFCVNYYLTADSLHIPDKNFFTATEITSAKPAYNASACNQFFSSNDWTSYFYPNMLQKNRFTVHEMNEPFSKRTLEGILNGKLGEWADEWLMRIFVWHWRNKYKDQDQNRFEVNFRSRRNVSKHHPHGFQIKVLQTYEQNLRSFEERYKLKFT